MAIYTSSSPCITSPSGLKHSLLLIRDFYCSGLLLQKCVSSFDVPLQIHSCQGMKCKGHMKFAVETVFHFYEYHHDVQGDYILIHVYLFKIQHCTETSCILIPTKKIHYSSYKICKSYILIYS